MPKSWIDNLVKVKDVAFIVIPLGLLIALISNWGTIPKRLEAVELDNMSQEEVIHKVVMNQAVIQNDIEYIKERSRSLDQNMQVVLTEIRKIPR